MLCFEANGVLSSLFFLLLLFKSFPVVHVDVGGMHLSGRPNPRFDLCLISKRRLGLPSGLVVDESP
jgi:hypothetical protein